MIQYLIKKEFTQIRRNGFIPKILVALPLLVVLVFPWAANQEIKNLRVTVVDNDHSPLSHRLTEKIAASTYFHLQTHSASYADALHEVEQDRADLILEIEPDFERHLARREPANLRISANAVNIMKGSMGANYMSAIIRDFSMDNGQTNSQLSILNSQFKFNPHLDYKIFMLPALLVMLLTIICGFLPTLNIVSEKEIGTIEQINVTPVSKTVFILSKLIPNWLFGLVVMSVYMLLAWLVYGLVPAGSLATIYFFAVLYILVVSGLGLVISNYSNTMQQAMFLMFFFLIVMLLLSGLFTPIASMPDWAQVMTCFNPLRYFVEVMRMVYLKGSGFRELIPQLFSLSIFALIMNSLAILSYRKSEK